MSQIPAAHARQSPAGQPQIPIAVKATRPTVPRVVGPRPLRSQRVFHAKREPALAVPKAMYPLPTWLTHFEDYEQEVLAEFCSPSEDSSPSTSTVPAMVGVELCTDRVIERPLFNTAPLSRFADSDSGSTCTDIEFGDCCLEEDEDFDEDDEDYDLLESDVYSDFGSDYVLLGPEPSTPAIYCEANAFEYQDQIGDGEGYLYASVATHPKFLLQGSPSIPSSRPCAHSFIPFDTGASKPPNSLPSSASTDPLTAATTTTSPPQPSVASAFAYNTADDRLIEAGVDRFLAEIEEGLEFGLRPVSESTTDSSEGGTEGWYDWFDPTDYTFPVPPQQSQSPRAAAGLKAPPLHSAAASLLDMEEGVDMELDAVVISPRSPVFWRH